MSNNYATGGHKLIQYGSSVRGAQLNYKLVKNSRLPIVLIRGTVVFMMT
ncbi:MAG: hypothetical protein CM15mV22_0620 [Eurybiavirus sp.]|nr:MAG: hypothetical protein CM15mV22_0620 [Eurybiavirus sp.]